MPDDVMNNVNPNDVRLEIMLTREEQLRSMLLTLMTIS
jgi:hypothetical protein